MARLSKCKQCEKVLQKDERYTYKNKTYCKECFDLLQSQIKVKKVKCKRCDCELSKDSYHKHNNDKYCEDCYEIVIKEAKEYKDLIDYIYKGFELEKINGMILKQIQRFKNEYHYSYGAIHYTLYYILEVCGLYMDVEKYGIGLVEKYYVEAEKYFLEQETMKQQLESIDVKSIIKKKIVKKSSVTPKQNSTLLDVDALLK